MNSKGGDVTETVVSEQSTLKADQLLKGCGTVQIKLTVKVAAMIQPNKINYNSLGKNNNLQQEAHNWIFESKTQDKCPRQWWNVDGSLKGKAVRICMQEQAYFSLSLLINYLK